ncbi:protein of unknown function [Thauera humireducens]|nr:protein of unknown function [Thauera humireducens]
MCFSSNMKLRPWHVPRPYSPLWREVGAILQTRRAPCKPGSAKTPHSEDCCCSRATDDNANGTCLPESQPVPSGGVEPLTMGYPHTRTHVRSGGSAVDQRRNSSPA